MLNAPSGNQYDAKFYGTAAISAQVDSTIQNWLGDACNKCYKVIGTGNVPGTTGFGKSTTLVLRAANYCPGGNINSLCNIPHFDIAAPGFDFTSSSASNSRNKAFSGNEARAFGECENWPGTSCNCNVFKDPILRAGCNNFKSLGWNNVKVDYVEVKCPRELAVNCWQNNDGTWPPFMDGYCARRDL